MQKKIITLLVLTTIIFNVTGCGSKNSKSNQNSNEILTQEVGEEVINTDDLFIGGIPDSIVKLKSETEPNILLQKKIIEYYEIPEDYWEATKYYYNYVDLNEDGKEEIFVVVMGMYTSGTGGSSALWCDIEEDQINILQAFTLINTPIIIAKGNEDEENNNNCLILQRFGGGSETEIVKLINQNNIFENVANAQTIESISGIKGTAIICNNLIEDMETNNFLTLNSK